MAIIVLYIPNLYNETYPPILLQVLIEAALNYKYEFYRLVVMFLKPAVLID